MIELLYGESFRCPLYRVTGDARSHLPIHLSDEERYVLAERNGIGEARGKSELAERGFWHRYRRGEIPFYVFDTSEEEEQPIPDQSPADIPESAIHVHVWYW